MPGSSGSPATKVLFLCRRHPFPLDRGDNRRVHGFVTALSQHADVRVLSLGGGSDLGLDGVTTRTVGVRGGSRRIIGRDFGAALLGNIAEPDVRLPAQVRASLDVRFARALREEMVLYRPDVLHASPSTMAPYLWATDSVVHRHLDLMDALSVVMAGDARLTRGPLRALLALEARLLRRYEARVVERSDSASLASAADKALAPGLERVEVISQAVDGVDFPFRPPARRAPVIVFVGNLGWPPNVEAVGRIATEIFPLVREVRPDARLRIVGVAAGVRVRQLSSLDGVEVTGAVPEIAPELHGAACALIPMWSGAGIKNKALEAFCAGTPVVGNRASFAGIPGLLAGEHVLIEEDPGALARACLTLMADERLGVRLAGAAKALVDTQYGWDARARQLLASYGRD